MSENRTGRGSTSLRIRRSLSAYEGFIRPWTTLPFLTSAQLVMHTLGSRGNRSLAIAIRLRPLDVANREAGSRSEAAGTAVVPMPRLSIAHAEPRRCQRHEEIFGGPGRLLKHPRPFCRRGQFSARLHPCRRGQLPVFDPINKVPAASGVTECLKCLV